MASDDDDDDGSDNQGGKGGIAGRGAACTTQRSSNTNPPKASTSASSSSNALPPPPTLAEGVHLSPEAEHNFHEFPWRYLANPPHLAFPAFDPDSASRRRTTGIYATCPACFQTWIHNVDRNFPADGFCFRCRADNRGNVPVNFHDSETRVRHPSRVADLVFPPGGPHEQIIADFGRAAINELLNGEEQQPSNASTQSPYSDMESINTADHEPDRLPRPPIDWKPLTEEQCRKERLPPDADVQRGLNAYFVKAKNTAPDTTEDSLWAAPKD